VVQQISTNREDQAKISRGTAKQTSTNGGTKQFFAQNSDSIFKLKRNQNLRFSC
jgi:hypothetical protein